MYKDSLPYKAYSYIEENIPKGAKIAHDHLVPIPSNKSIIECQYWQGCGTDKIEEFNPDYVIFSGDWKFNGKTIPESMRLKQYINDHHFILINTIDGPIPAGFFSISFWKKPGP